MKEAVHKRILEDVGEAPPLHVPVLIEFAVLAVLPEDLRLLRRRQSILPWR